MQMFLVSGIVGDVQNAVIQVVSVQLVVKDVTTYASAASRSKMGLTCASSVDGGSSRSVTYLRVRSWTGFV